MRWPVLPLLLLALAARADTLDATRGQPLRELAHTVRITVEDGVAHYRVERAYQNRGTIADEASLDIDLPGGAGVTGLRIRARDRWYDGDLMEATAAGRLYQELTGYGPFPVKDPALLQWVWPDKVHLQIFPVLPRATSTVEYALTAPVAYAHGRYHISYPRDAGPGLAPARFLVEGRSIRIGDEAARSGVLHAPARPALAAWDGVVERMPGASYVMSPVVIPDVARARAEVRVAFVDLELQHTYRGDLRVELVTPRGHAVVLHDRTGGNANDLRGRFPLALPAGTLAAGRWRLVISDHAARDVGTLARWSLSLDTGQGAPLVARSEGPLFIPDRPEGADDEGLIAIELAAPDIDTVAARLGRVVASPRHGFARLELDVAEPLRPAPVGAHVVFVVDASHSEGDAGIATQLALAGAYLGQVEDARFEVVLFRRAATRLVGEFAPAARFGELVAAARADGRLAPANGSALDLGLARAVEALRGQAGPRRIVVFTDGELRDSFAPAVVARTLAPLGKDTIVHVALPDRAASDETEARRDDAHALAPIAAGGHGIVLALQGVAGLPSSRLAKAVLELVRPIRIDALTVRGWTSSLPPALEEGHSLREMVDRAAPPEEVVLEGRLWAEPFRRVVRATPAFNRATAAFVFSEHGYAQLDPDEQMTVAMLGQVVSPVTSYIAVEPGTRPSRDGLIGHGGMGGSGSGYGSGMGGLGGRMRRVAPLPDLEPLAEAGACRCFAAHPAAPPVSLDVETTRDEIVDVVAGQGGPLAACLAEAVWAVRLPEAYAAVEREHKTVAFGGVSGRCSPK